MTRLETCPGCGDDLEVIDAPDALVRCGFCGTSSRLDVDADGGPDGYRDTSKLVIVDTDAGEWAVAWAQLLNQDCHEVVNDWSEAGRSKWERAMAARDELMDLLFERLYGARISGSDNLTAVRPDAPHGWGLYTNRDGLD